MQGKILNGINIISDTSIKLKVDALHERAYIVNLKREDRSYIMPNKLSRGVNTCQNITIMFKVKDYLYIFNNI